MAARRFEREGSIESALALRVADPSLLDIEDKDLLCKLFAIDFARQGLVDDAMFAAQGYVLSGYPGSAAIDVVERIRAGVDEYQEDILGKWLWEREPPAEGMRSWYQLDAAVPAFEEMIADLRSVGW